MADSKNAHTERASKASSGKPIIITVVLVAVAIVIAVAVAVPVVLLRTPTSSAPPPPPPQAPLPPAAPGAISVAAISFTVKLSGDVSSFGAYEQDAYKTSLASAITGITAADIELSVSSASIAVTAEITPPAAATSPSTTAVLSELAPLTANPTLLSTTLNVTVEEVTSTPGVLPASYFMVPISYSPLTTYLLTHCFPFDPSC